MLKTLRPPCYGLTLAALLIAGYRIVGFRFVGSGGWSFLVVASSLLWVMGSVFALAVLLCRPSPLYEVMIKSRISQAVIVAAIAAAAGFFSTPGLSSRVGLGLSAGLVAGALTTLLGRLAAREDGQIRRLSKLVDAVVILLLVPLLVSSGRPADLNGLAAVDLGNDSVSEKSIVLVGADGLDWILLEALFAKGRLPNLQALEASGVAGPLHTIQPTSSPYIWNSIYTGFSPAFHRRRPVHYAVSGSTFVSSFYSDYPDVVGFILGRRTESLRYPRAIWDVFGALGYETSVIGAWEQLPVPRRGKLFISRELEFDPVADEEVVPSLDPALIWTEGDLRSALAEGLVAASEIPRDEWAALLGDDVDSAELFNARLDERDDDRAIESRLARLRAVYASDRFRLHATKVMLNELDSPFFLFTYFRGVDVTQHSYAHQLRGMEQAGEPTDVVANYYSVLDQWIGELREEIGQDAYFFLVSDHGIDLNVDFSGQAYKTGWHPYAPHGVFMATGTGISSRRTLAAHVFDVAPTLLAAAGVPNLAAAEGRVINEVAEPTVLVEDWHRLEPTIYEMGNPLLADPALMRELRALGYVR